MTEYTLPCPICKADFAIGTVCKNQACRDEVAIRVAEMDAGIPSSKAMERLTSSEAHAAAQAAAERSRKRVKGWRRPPR